MTYTENSKTVLPDDSDMQRLEQVLLEGISLTQEHRGVAHFTVTTPAATSLSPKTSLQEDDEDQEDRDSDSDSDLQGAIALFAEAVQDLATAGVELGLGRHFACADSCNQCAEKSAQAVSLLRFGRRTRYNHDLKALGAAVNAPPEVQREMALLTPYHPEAFYSETPPEEADEVINADEASGYMQSARRVLRWARTLILES